MDTDKKLMLAGALSIVALLLLLPKTEPKKVIL